MDFQQTHARADALRLLGLTERQLRSWEKARLIEPAESYAFQDLVALRTLVKLKESKMRADRIQRAVEAVRAKLAGIENPLTQVKLYSEGGRIRVQVGRERMEPESGQLLLDFDRAELERMVTLPTRDRARNEALDRQRRAEELFQKGVELEQSGAPADRALEVYLKAVELDPDFAAAHVNLGTIFFTRQDFRRARKHYEAAVAANPKYPLAHFNLGNLYDEIGSRDEAYHHYQAALKLDSHYADAHYNIALLHQGVGDNLKALRHWKAYLKLDPVGPWAEVARRELAKVDAAVVVKGRRSQPGS